MVAARLAENAPTKRAKRCNTLNGLLLCAPCRRLVVSVRKSIVNALRGFGFTNSGSHLKDLSQIGFVGRRRSSILESMGEDKRNLIPQ
jgi:hypothetical protein